MMAAAAQARRWFRRLPAVLRVLAVVVTALLGLAAATAPFAGSSESPPPTTANVTATTSTTAPATTTTTSTSTTTTATPVTTRAPSTTVAVTTTRATTTSVAPVPSPAPTKAVVATTAPNGNGCHPSYAGACLPVDAADVDCAGGSGNGPVYVSEKRFRVVGPDVYDLDRDGDGIACES